MNFRQPADMLTLFPKRILAVWTDLTMPKRDWSKFDQPTVERKANLTKLRINRVRQTAIRNRNGAVA